MLGLLYPTIAGGALLAFITLLKIIANKMKVHLVWANQGRKEEVRQHLKVGTCDKRKKLFLPSARQRSCRRRLRKTYLTPLPCPALPSRLY
jgi:hypothetical protein